MNSPLLLTHFEHCNRMGHWSRDWDRAKIEISELLQAGIREGLTTKRKDFGEAAGECVVGISAKREIVSDHHDVYMQCIHTAALADLICCALRTSTDEPWTLAEPIQLGAGPIWHTDAMLSPDGRFLRRVVLASHWADDRHYSEARSWFSLGEVSAYGLPMQEAVIVLGQNREGKRHGYWSKGLLHPANKKLRFRKRTKVSEGFKDSWQPIFREDHDEISTREWLDAMHTDGVYQDVCFRVDIPLPDKISRQKIVDLAASKLDGIHKTTSLPDQQLSTCDWPSVCRYRNACHSGNSPNGKYGFVQIS